MLFSVSPVLSVSSFKYREMSHSENITDTHGIFHDKMYRYHVGRLFMSINLPQSYCESSEKDKDTHSHAGEDANPECGNPACSDTQQKLLQSFSLLKIDSSSSNNVDSKLPCPLSRSELGESAWDLIHTVAATYPDNPSEEDKQLMIHFINAIARFYPCGICAKDFQRQLKKHPVQ